MPRKTKLVEPTEYEVLKATLEAGHPPADTPAGKIQRWNELKQHLATQSKAFTDYCKQFRDEQDEIEGWLLNFLNTTGQNSAKTDAGTAYKSVLTQPKIVDRTAYLDWALDHWDTGGNEMLQIGAPQVSAFETFMELRKQVLKEYAEKNAGELPPDAAITPPGTEVSFFTRVNVRKS